MASVPTFRVTYQRYADVHADLAQMKHGGLLVRIADVADLALEAPVTLELVFPDGTARQADAKVLQVLTGHGVAVTVTQEIVAAAQSATGKDAGSAPPSHERLRARVAATDTESSQAQKIQLALHGNRDQRNAILRENNRALHQYVLKNPQITVDDVLAIAKNAQMGGEVLKMIADRKEWFQRPQIALALARNPKTPPDVGVRALDHVSMDALRQIAKGGGALPHVVAAARKKVLAK